MGKWFVHPTRHSLLFTKFAVEISPRGFTTPLSTLPAPLRLFGAKEQQRSRNAALAQERSSSGSSSSDAAVSVLKSSCGSTGENSGAVAAQEKHSSSKGEVRARGNICLTSFLVVVVS